MRIVLACLFAIPTLLSCGVRQIVELPQGSVWFNSQAGLLYLLGDSIVWQSSSGLDERTFRQTDSYMYSSRETISSNGLGPDYHRTFILNMLASNPYALTVSLDSAWSSSEPLSFVRVPEKPHLCFDTVPVRVTQVGDSIDSDTLFSYLRSSANMMQDGSYRSKLTVDQQLWLLLCSGPTITDRWASHRRCYEFGVSQAMPNYKRLCLARLPAYLIDIEYMIDENSR